MIGGHLLNSVSGILRFFRTYIEGKNTGEKLEQPNIMSKKDALSDGPSKRTNRPQRKTAIKKTGGVVDPY